MIPLYIASRHLHAKLDERGRQVALKLLFATFLLDVPFGAIMFLEKAGLHLPDYMSHLALSF